MQATITNTPAFAQLCQATATHPNYTDGTPLVLDFRAAHSAYVLGLDTLEARLLEAHIRAAAAVNPSICYVFDALRASARGDARTGRTLRSTGTDGAPYWTGMGSSKDFRAALGAFPWLSQTHAAHNVVTTNGEDGTSGPAGRAWQSTGFTRTRTRIQAANAAPQATLEQDADGMDAPSAPAPIRRGKGKSQAK